MPENTDAQAASDILDQDLAGLDTLDTPLEAHLDRAARVWQATWPKLLAVALALGVWQLIAWLELKPSYVLPGPGPVLSRLAEDVADGTLLSATWTTMRRALVGFGLALVIGVLLGLAVARSRLLRSAVGAMLTGLQTMPSIAWFPLAILLFQLSEGAILFVVVLGAAPAIANGLIHGIDHIPPLLLRAGKVLGARGIDAYRYVVLPAALPGFTAGLKQGWAFAWRSLMAGELLVIIAARPSLGAQLQLSREISDATGLLAGMLAILIVGIVVDGLCFGPLERSVRRRWGLVEGKRA
jgi:NitT/TauT family transport system permease protein